jgi:hypothetical protein
MDPQATWTRLCATLGELGEHPDDADLRDEVIELLEALAAWLRSGGFPPMNVRLKGDNP